MENIVYLRCLFGKFMICDEAYPVSTEQVTNFTIDIRFSDIVTNKKLLFALGITDELMDKDCNRAVRLYAPYLIVLGTTGKFYELNNGRSATKLIDMDPPLQIRIRDETLYREMLQAIGMR